MGQVTQGIRDDYVTDEAELLAQILVELKALREFAERAAGFLDNPVKRYRESMREAKRDRTRRDPG